MKKNAYIVFALLILLGTSAIAAPQADGSRLRLDSILEKSNHFYESVRNYRAIFYKQERAGEKIAPQEKIFLKFEKPFKIFMGWLDTEKKDLQVVYERGKHQGKLAIHKPGLAFGLMPVIFLKQDSPWVREGSQAYDIEDAGIGTFLNDFTKAVKKSSAANKLRVNFLPPSLPRGDQNVEVVFEDAGNDADYFAYRILVCFDSVTGLPVKMQLFDANNQITGTYSYEDIQINLPAKDTEFEKVINKSLYRVYRES